MVSRNRLSEILPRLVMVMILFSGASNLLAESLYRCIIQDDADLLTGYQEQLLEQDMMPILEYGNVAFISTQESHEGSASDFAKETCLDLFQGESSTVFLIDMDHRRIEIYSRGTIYKVVGRSRADGITDNIYRLATEGEYYQCAKECYSQILVLLQGGFLFVPMRYVSAILFCFGFVTLVLFFLLFMGRKMYSLGNRVSLIENMEEKNEAQKKKPKTSNVRVYRTTLLKQVKKELSENYGSSCGSSSSGGSYGGSSGGGSSGGGGGHGF